MTSIDWATLDWPSIATAYAGTIAALAAAIVGARQVGITKQQAGIAEAQNTILARQTEIEAQNLKADLFDRRFETFEVVVDFIINVRAYGEDQSAPGRVRFFTKYNESQFLFSPSVFRDLKEILDRAQALWSAMAMMRSDREHALPHNPTHSQRALEEGSWMLQRLETLADVFRNDLRLDDLTSAAKA